jgi:hypothetical protein
MKPDGVADFVLDILDGIRGGHTARKAQSLYCAIGPQPIQVFRP